MILSMGKGENDRQSVSGLKEHYTMEELMGRTVVVFANLQPHIIRGIESAGMLLGAEFKGKCQLLTPDADITTGARVC
jgi:methionine--tRNA ligase beta chain